jgi:hypothetical protein
MRRVKIVARLWLPAIGAGFVLVITGSGFAALLAFALGGLIALTPVLEQGVSRLLRMVGTAFFVAGAAFVVLVTRLASPSRDQGVWQAAPARAVSESAYAKMPESRTWKSALRSTTALLLLLLLADVAVGSTLSDPPVIPQSERLESAPSVNPGDIEYQVQRDGERLYLTPTPGPRWQQTNLKSATTNWSNRDGRTTYNGSSRTSEPQRIAVIGGSAAFGLGQSDDMTVASELAKILESAGQNVEVKNFGVPGYTTVQAVSDLEDRMEQGLHVDTVVAYTGSNDVTLGLFGRRVPQTLLDGAMNVPSGPLTWWLNNSAVARAAGHQPVRRKPIVWRVLNIHFDGSWELSDRTGADASRDALYNLEEGYKALQLLAKERQLKVVIVYQPTWFEARLAQGDTKLVNMDDLGRELIGARWEAVRRSFLTAHPDTIDAARFVDNQPCWLDYTHTRGLCSAAIARQIVEHPQWEHATTKAAK